MKTKRKVKEVMVEDSDLLSTEEAKKPEHTEEVKPTKKLLGQHPITGKDVYQE